MGRLYTEPPSPARQEHEDECCKKVNKITQVPVLGHSTESAKAVSRHCKYSELFKGSDLGLLEFPPRGMLFIRESDVYRLVMRSMPESAALSCPARTGETAGILLKHLFIFDIVTSGKFS